MDASSTPFSSYDNNNNKKKNGSKHYLCSPWVESGENSLWSRTTKLEETHIFTVTTKEILAMDWLEMELEK